MGQSDEAISASPLSKIIQQSSRPSVGPVMKHGKQLAGSKTKRRQQNVKKLVGGAIDAQPWLAEKFVVVGPSSKSKQELTLDL